MKEIVFLLLTGFIYSCAPDVYMTRSRAGNEPRANDIKGILVAAITKDIVLKSAFEKDLSSQLLKRGYFAVKSIDEFPPEFLKDSTDKTKLTDKMKEKRLDGILTVLVLRKESDFRYTPGACTYYPTHAQYHYFWGYYSYWYPCVYSPGYYVNEINYFIESNLYDGKSGELIWSAQSKAHSVSYICTITPQFAKEIVSKMTSDGVLKRNTTAASGVRE